MHFDLHYLNYHSNRLNPKILMFDYFLKILLFLNHHLHLKNQLNLMFYFHLKNL